MHTLIIHSTRTELLHPLYIIFQILPTHTRTDLLRCLHQILLTYLLVQQLSLRQLRYFGYTAHLHESSPHGHVGRVSTDVANVCAATSFGQFDQFLPIDFGGNCQLFKVDVEHFASSLLPRQRNIYIYWYLHILFSSLRLKASSKSQGRFVAARTKTDCYELPTPSICTNNSVLTFLVDSCSFSDRFVAMESIQSKKITLGE